MWTGGSGKKSVNFTDVINGSPLNCIYAFLRFQYLSLSNACVAWYRVLFIMFNCSRHFLRAIPRTFRISLFRRRRTLLPSSPLLLFPPSGLRRECEPGTVVAVGGGGEGGGDGCSRHRYWVFLAIARIS